MIVYTTYIGEKRLEGTIVEGSKGVYTCLWRLLHGRRK
jgi:hypothetical protein